jgi:uncharacterized protein YkwD
LIAAHNGVRAESKLPALKPSRQLVQAAEDHARDMAAHHINGHDGSDGSDPFQRIKRRGYAYQTAGENVAHGQTSIAEVMTVWINSPDHRKKILGDFTEIGAAMARDEIGHTYWCVDLGRPWPILDPVEAPAALLAAMNKARLAAGRSKLREDRELARVADKFAKESAAKGKVTSTGPDGQSPFDMLKGQGYRARQLAFSIASGQSSADEVVTSWLERKDDKDLLLGRFDRAGAGVRRAEDGTPYWVVLVALK